MADVDSLPVGSFCWPELATSDQGAGVAFYRALFGWDLNEMSMGPDGVYSTFQMRGRPVAAAATQRPEERQHGVPPHWNTYITVENADDAVKRSAALGGSVLAPAFDVSSAGRMAVLADPTGAVFQVWQPKEHIGLRVNREPGTLCWTELVTHDTKAAERFYTQMFGWKTKTGGSGPDEYTEFAVSGLPSGGMMAIRPEWPKMPANWTPYFQVTDCDASTTKAKSLGAQVGVPPADIPNTGRFSMLADPQGARFALFQPKS
jgi:predicted enzyme related to lactoylglutathione lyase